MRGPAAGGGGSVWVHCARLHCYLPHEQLVAHSLRTVTSKPVLATGNGVVPAAPGLHHSAACVHEPAPAMIARASSVGNAKLAAKTATTAASSPGASSAASVHALPTGAVLGGNSEEGAVVAGAVGGWVGPGVGAGVGLVVGAKVGPGVLPHVPHDTGHKKAAPPAQSVGNAATKVGHTGGSVHSAVAAAALEVISGTI